MNWYGEIFLQLVGIQKPRWPRASKTLCTPLGKTQRVRLDPTQCTCAHDMHVESAYFDVPVVCLDTVVCLASMLGCQRRRLSPLRNYCIGFYRCNCAEAIFLSIHELRYLHSTHHLSRDQATWIVSSRISLWHSATSRRSTSGNVFDSDLCLMQPFFSCDVIVLLLVQF